MKAKLKFGGKEIEIPDVEKVSGIKKIVGLMFNSKSNALLFEFENPGKQAIHSLFCPDFLAIWLDKDNKILEYKLIISGKMTIKPEKEFSKLLEIPLNNKYSHVIRFFLGKEKV